MEELILSKINDKNFVYKSFLKGLITTIICLAIIWLSLSIIMNGNYKQYQLIVWLLFFLVFVYSTIDFGLAILVARRQLKLKLSNGWSLWGGILINIILLVGVLISWYQVFMTLNVKFLGF